MTTLLEIREKILSVYKQYEGIATILFRFLTVLLALRYINDRIGYRDVLTSGLLSVIIALMGTILPYSAVAGILALLIIVHLYTLSLEAAGVAAILFILMFLLFFRFAPKDVVLILLTPVFAALHLGYTLPVIAGLLYGPASGATLSVGLIVMYFVNFVSENKATIGAVSEEQDMLARFRFLVDGLMQNKELLVMMIAAAVTAMAVYIIRRLPIKYAWLVGAVAGSVLQVIVLLAGDLMFGTNISIAGAIVGMIVSVLISAVVTFLMFNLDYSRIESAQFEDDDYYYYVKAVPKMTASAPKKRTVKRISQARQSYTESNWSDDGYTDDEDTDDGFLWDQTDDYPDDGYYYNEDL